MKGTHDGVAERVGPVEERVEVGQKGIADIQGQFGGLRDHRDRARILVFHVLGVVIASKGVKGPSSGPFGTQRVGCVVEEAANVRAHLEEYRKAILLPTLTQWSKKRIKFLHR